MENFKGMSRDKRTKFLEDMRKIIDKGVLPKPKKVGGENETCQRRKINKDDREAIVRNVVTAIGESTFNDDKTNTENNQQSTTGKEEQIIIKPKKDYIEKAKDKMSVNELINTRAERYLNVHLIITMTVVYNGNRSRIMSDISHSIENTTIDIGFDTSLIG